MPRYRSHRMLTREIGTGHRFLAPVALLEIRQGLSHGPPLRAGDFVQRGCMFDLCLHRLHEGFRAQVDLALQSRPHAGPVGAFVDELYVLANRGRTLLAEGGKVAAPRLGIQPFHHLGAQQVKHHVARG